MKTYPTVAETHAASLALADSLFYTGRPIVSVFVLYNFIISNTRGEVAIPYKPGISNLLV